MSANGQLQPSELTAIQGQYLSNLTAAAFIRMSDASFKANNVHLKISPGGGYRDLAAQQYLIDHPEGPVPIAPLGYSTHGDGRAVDIANYWLVYGWLKNHAHEFGFTQQFASENWHWRYDNITGAGAGTPIRSSRKKKVMEFRVITESGIGVVYGETTFVEIDPKTDPIEFAASESAHGAGADRMYLTENEWRIEKIQITKRREQVGLPATGTGSAIPSDLATKTDVDKAAQDVIKNIPTGATVAQVKAEADRVIGKIPTKAALS